MNTMNTENTAKIIEEAYTYFFNNVHNVFGETLRTPKTLYYYSSLNTFINGIIVASPKPNQEICIWANRSDYMNDEMEINSGLSLLPQNLKESHEKAFENHYSLSFTRSKDALQMWNMYGDNGKGVMLCLDVQSLKQQFSVLLQPCLYEGTKLEQKISKSINDLNLGLGFSQLEAPQRLLSATLFMTMFISLRKHNKYKHEAEIRAIINNPLLFPFKETFYRVQNNLIIPYVKEYLSKNTLKEIWLGPCCSERNFKTIKEFLTQKNIHINIKKSQIPYTSFA